MKNTALTEKHISLGAKMVPFAGYNMPVQYEGINVEHATVRNAVGVFDVSHMGEFILKGENALDLIQRITSNDAAKLPEGKIQYYARIGADTRIQNMQRMPKNRQLAILVSYVYHYTKVAVDELITVFSQYLNSRFKKVKREEEKYRLRTLNDLDLSANKLMKAVTYILDDSIPDDLLRQTIFSSISKEELGNSIAKVDRLTSDDRDLISITSLMGYYSTIKRFLPEILKLVSLKGTVHGKNTVHLWHFLQTKTSNKITPESYNKIKEYLPKRWAQYGERNPNNQMNVVVFATLEQGISGLKNHDVFLENSIKYINPLNSLFAEEEWKVIKEDVVQKME